MQKCINGCGPGGYKSCNTCRSSILHSLDTNLMQLPYIYLHSHLALAHSCGCMAAWISCTATATHAHTLPQHKCRIKDEEKGTGGPPAACSECFRMLATRSETSLHALDIYCMGRSPACGRLVRICRPPPRPPLAPPMSPSIAVRSAPTAPSIAQPP